MERRGEREIQISNLGMAEFMGMAFFLWLELVIMLVPRLLKVLRGTRRQSNRWKINIQKLGTHMIEVKKINGILFLESSH